MADTQQTYKMRKRTEKGEWDTLSHAAIALLTGSNAPVTPASVEGAMQDIASANGLKRFKIVQTIDVGYKNADGAVVPSHRISVVEVDNAGKPVPGGVSIPGKWTALTKPVTANAKGETKYDCIFYEYREKNGKPLVEGRVLNKPNNFHAFAKPTRQVFAECVECIIPPAATENDPEPVAFGMTPNDVTQELPPQVLDFNSRAKLSQFPTAGTNGQGDAYTVLNTPLLLGHSPDQPAIAARGRNRNSTGIHTPGDVANIVADVPLQAFPFSLNGYTGIFVPFHLQTPDSANNVQPAKQGSNQRDDKVNRALNELVTAHNQWPFNGKFNPLATGDKEFREATLLPGVGTSLDAQGNIGHAKDTLYANNHLHVAYGNVPSYTASQIAVDSNFKEKNQHTWGTPSASVGLFGMSNYATAEIVHQLSIVPQLDATSKAYDEAIKVDNKAAAKEAAQKYIGLLNYDSTLTGISNYRVINDVSNITTDEQLNKLNPAERLAAMKARLIKEAGTQGITGLDANFLPKESPVRTIPKERMHDLLVNYYTEVAKNNPSAFARIYAEKEHVGQELRHDLSKEDDRTLAAQEFVANLPFYKTYEGGVELKAVDRFVSTRDPNAPTDIKKDNFNRIERGDVAKVPPSQEMETGAMQAIATDPALTKILLQNTVTNRKLAETLALRDRLSMDLPGDFGDHSLHFFGRGNEGVKALGYSQEVMETQFNPGQGQGIIRGDVSAIQRDLSASAGDPALVAARQQTLTTLATDGSNNYIGLPVGSLQTALLYSLAAEPDTKTLNALIAHIKQTDPQRAEERIAVLEAGVQFAKNKTMQRDVGIDHDALKSVIAAQQIVSASVAGTNLDARVDEKKTVIDDTKRKEAISSHFAEPKNIKHTKALFEAQAAHGTKANHATIIDAAVALPDAERIHTAKLALKALDGLDSTARGALVAGLGDKAAVFSKLKPATLTADQATTVLAALKGAQSGDALVVGAIAKDSKASQAIATALIAKDKTFVATLSNGMTAEGVAAVATASGIAAADLKDPKATQTITQTTTVTVPADRQMTFDLARAQFNNADQRGVTFVAHFLTDPINANKSLELLMTRQPGYATALVLNTLQREPELMKSTAENLRKLGNPGFLDRLFSNYPQGKLAYIMQELSTSMQTGNSERAQEMSAQLQSFMAEPTNARAVNDMMTAMLSSKAGERSGRDALLATINTTLGNALSGAEAPLAGRTLNTRQTLDMFYQTVVQTDRTQQDVLAKLGLTHLGSMQAIHDNWNWPLLIIPTGKPGKPDEPTNRGTKPGCETNCSTLPQPVTPGTPVTPSPTPPVLQPTAPALQPTGRP